eukprot:CAMPEP_0204582868 /NCGR_PEP_ID=MMETSP0661-20131031/45459_1 /ASSEMBLY_ACC=CAM_ASM_000606 /TAXON_ID=109239 /ORGANISM="Alexandrium margalefi, Strain AMGDE01CS-322" /LENGTH=30 /DNA_ID= /DNA_START= /DNA_END= /DNA_ORIENTATION=
MPLSPLYSAGLVPFEPSVSSAETGFDLEPR